MGINELKIVESNKKFVSFKKFEILKHSSRTSLNLVPGIGVAIHPLKNGTSSDRLN